MGCARYKWVLSDSLLGTLSFEVYTLVSITVRGLGYNGVGSEAFGFGSKAALKAALDLKLEVERGKGGERGELRAGLRGRKGRGKDFVLMFSKKK